jgi:hypothetical protein
MFKNYFLILAIFILGPSFAYSQSRIIDTLIEKMNNYGASKSQTSLFIHYDKTIYTNHEYVWFTGYLLNHDQDLSEYETLSIALVRNENRKIGIENKFVIKNGIASGCIFLPDSLTAGNYNLVAFTNRIVNDQPEGIFIQPIVIKNSFSEFTTSISLLDSNNQHSDSVKVLIKARTPDLLPLEGAHINYIIGTGTNQGKIHESALNKSGETIIAINRKDIPTNNNQIYVQVNAKGILKDMSLTLPTLKSPSSVRFYPEGGFLIHNTPCKIGWEAKTSDGNPMSVAAILYEGNQIIDTIQTSGYGIGRFNLTPRIGAKYTVKVLNESFSDVYTLPEIQATIPSLNIEQSIVSDTLKVKLHNTNSDNKLFLILHRYNELFHVFEVSRNSSEQVLNIPLSKLPKGIAEITLINNLQKPLAERLFFAHYDRKSVLSIEPNKEVYDKKDQVEITLQLDSIKPAKKSAIVSIACIQSNRLDIRKATDIESYTYLNQILTNLPFKHLPLQSALENNDYLEDVLLIKGWRRYNWNSLMNAKDSDSLTGKKTLEINGQLLKNNFPYNRSTQINVLADSAFKFVTTNSKGYFVLNPEIITVKSQKTVKLFMNKEDTKPYSFKINDQFKQLQDALANKLDFINYEESIKSFNTGEMVLKKDETSNHLVDVIVSTKIKNGDNHFYGQNPLTVNECGDRVCYLNYLNCTIHFNDLRNQPAIMGKMYKNEKTDNLEVYTGCKKQLDDLSKIVGGIFVNKDFYQIDNESPLINEPEYISTLYWNPQVLLNTDTTFKISFKTGVIPGKFKIIVQGRTDDDVIYQESFIMVK